MSVDETPKQDPTQVVDGLVGAIKAISADPNYNLLANIFSEVLHLRKKNAELVCTNRNVFEQYWDFRRELEEAQAQLEAAKEDVEAKLAGRVEELSDMTDARDRLDSELADTKNELSDTTSAKDKLEVELGTANEHLAELQTAKAGLEEELGRVSTQLEEQKQISETAAQQIVELQASLTQCETDLETTRGNLADTDAQLQEMTQERDSLKETLFFTESDLHLKTGRLNELDSYRVELHDQPEDMYVKILDTIWTRLFQLVEEHFRQDLDEKVLHDASCWTNLRSAEALKGPTQIPLPQSNSQVAKAMRIASVMSVLSRTLHKYIFRPFYLMDDDTELTTLLHGVEFESPAKEVNIRSTLLATLPEIQRLSAKARVQHVVREVSWVVQHLLGALPYDAFCSALREACIVACTEWQKIQMAKMKIEPYFGPPYDEFDWQALPLHEFDGHDPVKRRCSVASGSSSTRANSPMSIKEVKEGLELDHAVAVAEVNDVADLDGTGLVDETHADHADHEGQEDHENASDVPNLVGTTLVDDPLDDEADKGAAADAPAAHDHDDAIADDSDKESDMDPGDILLVVWPCMAVVENGDQQPITQGLVVTKEQAAAAVKEMHAYRHGMRLGSKKSRTMSVLTMGSPRPNKSFLSVAGGDEVSIAC